MYIYLNFLILYTLFGRRKYVIYGWCFLFRRLRAIIIDEYIYIEIGERDVFVVHYPLLSFGCNANKSY